MIMPKTGAVHLASVFVSGIVKMWRSLKKTQYFKPHNSKLLCNFASCNAAVHFQ